MTTSWFYGPSARTVARLGATFPATDVTAARAFGAEALVTFLLAFVIVVVATTPRVSTYASAAMGAALAAAILISGPISGAGVNPARAIGPMIAAGHYTDWWVYVGAPLLGALVGVAAGVAALRYTDAA